MNSIRSAVLTAALCALFVPVALAGEKTAKELNGEGYELYKQKKYGEAVEIFRKAIDADEQYAMAHYNLACTLSLLREQKKVCEYDAYRGTIVEELRLAVNLDEGRRKKMKTDPDLASVRDTIVYQELVGVSAKSAKNTKALLEAVSWWGPGIGVYGSILSMDFDAGKVTVTRKVVEPDDIRNETFSGSFTVSGRKVIVSLDAPFDGKKVFEGTLDANGLLKFPDPLGSLFDAPSECDA